MPQAKVLQEAYSSTPSALIEMWQLDGTAIGLSTMYYFVNSSTSSFQPVVFNGITYTPFPIQVDKVDVDGKGGLPRPTLTVSNVNGFVSNLLLQNAQLVGATVTRIRVHARYLDAVNFPTPRPPWVTPDPTAAYAAEPWMVNRKITENPQVVSWELASPLESQGAQLPRQQVVGNLCTNWKYRQTGTCNYSGAPVSDVAGRLFTAAPYSMTLVSKGTYNAATTYARGDYVTLFSTIPQFAAIPTVWVCTTAGTLGVTPASSSPKWVLDACNKTVGACKAHFGTAPLRTSAFPGVSRSEYSRN